MEVEDDVGVAVLPGHRVRPQLLHEEYLVREVRRRACGRRERIVHEKEEETENVNFLEKRKSLSIF